LSCRDSRLPQRGYTGWGGWWRVQERWTAPNKHRSNKAHW